MITPDIGLYSQDSDQCPFRTDVKVAKLIIYKDIICQNKQRNKLQKNRVQQSLQDKNLCIKFCSGSSFLPFKLAH